MKHLLLKLFLELFWFQSILHIDCKFLSVLFNILFSIPPTITSKLHDSLAQYFLARAVLVSLKYHRGLSYLKCGLRMASGYPKRSQTGPWLILSNPNWPLESLCYTDLSKIFIYFSYFESLYILWADQIKKKYENF